MSIDTRPSELHAAAERARKGERDPNLRKIVEEMDKDREELRKRVGTLNIAVDFVREARDA